MEIQQLRYFVEVARKLNFTRAAESCHVAQPTLSQQLRKLETELGGPLFHRLGRRILLTDLGDALLPRAVRLLQIHKETLDEAGSRSDGGGIVRFGSTLTIAPYLFPNLCGSLAETHPTVGMEIREDFTENLLQDLKEGVLDFAILATPVGESAMLSRTVHREPFLAVLPQGHALSKQRNVSIHDLLQEKFLPLSQIHCAGKQIGKLCRSGKKAARMEIQCHQIESILRLVETGNGVTILPRMAVFKCMGRRLEIRSLKLSRAHREIAIVHHRDRYLGTSARQIMTAIEIAFAKLEPRNPETKKDRDHA